MHRLRVSENSYRSSQQHEQSNSQCLKAAGNSFRIARKRQHPSCRSNLRSARDIWGMLPQRTLESLRNLTSEFALSVASGHLVLLEGKWYVTHAGLLKIAQKRRCLGIAVCLQHRLSDPASSRWVFKATVYKSPGSKGFVGYGDADPANVFSLVRGAEMRIAETRAVNRALRKAYGIGLCSVEELGRPSSAQSPSDNHAPPSTPCAPNGSNNGHPRLRDQLCLLIRKYELDPTLVKRYAADFCGTETLRDASRDLVEAFISTLADEAAKDRAALICKLNSYSQLEEVKS
jgi:hypothetical protein